MVTLAALTIASAAASAATYPLVSIIPIALLGITFSLSSTSQCTGRGLLPACIGVDGSDDQCVHRGWSSGEPVGRDRSLRDQDALADSAAQHVEGDQARARPVGFDFEKGARRQPVDAAGGPDLSGYGRRNHLRSLLIVTPSERAFSRASGVITAFGPSVRAPPDAAISMMWRSVTAPLSMRCVAACVRPVWELANRKLNRPLRRSARLFGFSNSRSSCRTNVSRSASVAIRTVSTRAFSSAVSGAAGRNPVCPFVGCAGVARSATAS